MKKIFLFVVLAVLSQGMFLFAQDTTFNNESEFYYFNVAIEKIFTHSLGYMIIYQTNSNRMVRTFLPMEWFSTIGGRGAMVYMPSGREWPSMTVYYKNGEFSHVLVRVRSNRAHSTWGMVPLNTDMREHFHGIEEVRLEF